MSDVLIVDDSPADRALFRTLLHRGGFRVHEVATGREALERAATARPHVIVLDVNLPDTDGHSVCRALRADPLTQGIPVLMLTVRDHEADILAGLEAGADDYIAKDAAAEIFLARIRRLVRFRQMADVMLLNERLVQVGRLLAGIVHEIRGPLSVIRGNAELLRMSLDEQSPSLQWLDPIVRSVQTLQARLEHLMAAVRGGPASLRPLELAPLVREAADLFRKGSDLWQGRIAVLVEQEADLPPVLADAGRLLQVLLNLLANAREAILGHGGQGRIVVRSRRATDPDSGREGVVVEVADSGPGIPEGVLDRLFEPFFTTKSDGSGYGLYLALEIVREHSGRISACNAPEGGACFSTWLPLAPETAP
ncbi:response regulator [soil metagenome]